MLKFLYAYFAIITVTLVYLISSRWDESLPMPYVLGICTISLIYGMNLMLLLICSQKTLPIKIKIR